MRKRGNHRKRQRVEVPGDVRHAVLALGTKETRIGRFELAKLLGVALCTIDELVNVGGAIQSDTLERVRMRLRELAAKKTNGAA